MDSHDLFLLLGIAYSCADWRAGNCKDLSVFDLKLNRVAGSPVTYQKGKLFDLVNLEIRYFSPSKVAELCSHRDRGLDPARGSGAVTGFRWMDYSYPSMTYLIISSRSW